MVPVPVFCLEGGGSGGGRESDPNFPSRGETDTGRMLQAPRGVIVGLLQVLADAFRHLAHRHVLLAAETLLERGVSVDHALALAVLPLLSLGVAPALVG